MPGKAQVKEKEAKIFFPSFKKICCTSNNFLDFYFAGAVDYRPNAIDTF